MSGEALIRAQAAAKKFTRSLRRSMLYGLADTARDFAGIAARGDRLRPEEFWALEDVGFEVRRGECLGLIGPNGAGKSTLLKMINGLIIPDRGRIEVQGRVGALIELGAGFHPLLTGRENVYINGGILGLAQKEIDREFDAIVAFAEIGDFIDTPVKFYSSGMYVRLGFAVAARLDPDVLLIDEILAVGDVGFRAKCYNLLAEMMPRTAVILVSHSMPMIARYATRILVLDRGRAFEGADKAASIDHYYKLYPDHERTRSAETGHNRMTDLKIAGEARTGEPLRIAIRAELEEDKPLVHLAFLSQENAIVATTRTREGELPAPGGRLHAEIVIDPLVLAPGLYKMSVVVLDRARQRHLIWREAALSFQVKGELSDYGPTAVVMPAECRDLGPDPADGAGPGSD